MIKASIETDMRYYGLSHQQAEHDKEIRNNAIDKFKAEVRKELGVQSNADRIRAMSYE